MCATVTLHAPGATVKFNARGPVGFPYTAEGVSRVTRAGGAPAGGRGPKFVPVSCSPTPPSVGTGCNGCPPAIDSDAMAGGA